MVVEAAQLLEVTFLEMMYATCCGTVHITNDDPPARLAFNRDMITYLSGRLWHKVHVIIIKLNF